MELGQKSNW